MKRYYISEMDENASKLAAENSMGLELIGFCDPANMENDNYIAKKQKLIQEFDCVSLHAPYYEIFPSAIDPMVRNVALHRMRQTIKLCVRLGIKRMVAHSGYAPQLYYPQWFVPKSIAFWKEIAPELPGDFELLLENVLDVRPEYLAEVCDGAEDSRIKICLDIGHANAYSDVSLEEWIQILGRRIAHVHMHNNDGLHDLHASVQNGSIDIKRTFAELDLNAPEASICIESLDAGSCLKYLAKEGYI